MTLTSYWRRVLVAGPVIWLLVGGGMYLWSIRGALGFRSVASTSIEIPIGTGGGPIVFGGTSSALVVACSVQIPLRANHSYELNCVSTMILMLGPLNNPIDVGLNASGSGFLISPMDEHVRLGAGERAQLQPFQITPISSGSQRLVIAATAAGSTRTSEWSLDVELKPIEITLVSALLALTLAWTYNSLLEGLATRNRLRALTQARIEKAESKAEQAPEKAKFAWELATVRLEAYFDRNLSQVSQVFWLAAAVTVIGFLFVLWAIIASLNQPQFTARAVIAGASGVITEFIGATVLVVYRSIMAQANEFIAVLERINTVGMAVQILDSIPEDQVELKNSTRSNLVALLAGMKSNLKTPPV